MSKEGMFGSGGSMLKPKPRPKTDSFMGGGEFNNGVNGGSNVFR